MTGRSLRIPLRPLGDTAESPNAEREKRNSAQPRRCSWAKKQRERFPPRPPLSDRGRSARRWPDAFSRLGAESETHRRCPRGSMSAAKEVPRTFHPLIGEEDGYFSGSVPAVAGQCYRFRVDNAEHFHPDPASRFQPHGPHGSSCIVDPGSFKWSDVEWRGKKLKGQIFYEMHVGTFTRQGTWAAAVEQLPELARIGITVIEMMPIADFPGNFGWGYDGVDLFAPTRLLRDARRSAQLHRSGAQSRSRGNSGCRLQPLRPGRKLSARLLRGLLYTEVRKRLG